MGVIRKKTATRGGEGGVKYVCEICSADITNTVRIRCAHSVCNEYDLCVECFKNGESSANHHPPTHPFNVIEQNSVPIYDKDWGADEELLLLEGCETYGLGSWADVADHIGGYRDKDEVAKHYIDTYINSPKFPLPARASPKDLTLLNQVPREQFQALKKRRIEDRKEKQKNAPPPQSKKKPTASVPACHEVQGYMPGRLEFETEYANEAEEAVQLMQFDPGDGINPRTGELEPEMDLKMTVMDVYNARLTQRAERKKVIFEHNLLEYRKNSTLDKKRTKEERDILNKAKPFARMMNREDFEEFCDGLIREHNLRQAITQLQDWRNNKIETLKGGEKYEQEKAQRVQNKVPMGSLDRERFASSQRSKQAPVIETPSGAALLVAPELPIRLTPNTAANTPVASPGRPALAEKTNGTALSNGHATNGTGTPQTAKVKYQVQPISGITPLPLSQENAPDIHLLTADEIELCKVCRIQPKPYLVIKERIIKESVTGNGTLKKKQVKELAKVDSQKGGRIFDYFVNAGWIGKA
ncbi:Transcriptional adapter [Lachnellula subtilissima]|uniref:Transcriptional adapter 2 n=1 Tax=Lachnellula subtilissima TaxID=602034 RepID=A0A8H8RZ60_9HELO|nr:Transcriptional adapter [Lachnellula subtilissima]